MEKDKHGGGLPPSGRFSGISSTGNLFNIKAEPPQATAFGQGMSLDINRFSHDLSRMPDNPPRNMGHRRAHSEILTLPDDISFDSDLGVVGGADGPSFSDDIDTDDLLSAYLDMGKVNSSSATSAFQVGEPFSGAAGAQTGGPPSASPATAAVENARGESSERLRIRHQHSQSMDWSTMIKPETLVSGSEDTYGADSKKAVSAAKLAELSLIDPKRAKRIWANRQSAARSKERKMRYIAELERKVQTLQTEATSLSAQLTILQRDTNSLAAENSELKLRLQSMEQQVHLQDALNDTLKEEIHHLKILTGQTNPNGGPMMKFPASSYRGSQPLYPSNQAMQTLLTAQQLQQLQIHSQNPQHQLHQLQQHAQQEQPQQLQQQQQQQLTEDLKISGGSMLAPSQKENASDLRTPVSKD